MRQQLLTVAIFSSWTLAAVGAVLAPFRQDIRLYIEPYIFVVGSAVTLTICQAGARMARGTQSIQRSEVRRLGNIVEISTIAREGRQGKSKPASSEEGIVSLIIEGRQIGVKVEKNTPINIAAVRAAMQEVRETAS